MCNIKKLLRLDDWKIEVAPVLIDESNRFIDEKEIWGCSNYHRLFLAEIDGKMRWLINYS